MFGEEKGGGQKERNAKKRKGNSYEPDVITPRGLLDDPPTSSARPPVLLLHESLEALVDAFALALAFLRERRVTLPPHLEVLLIEGRVRLESPLDVVLVGPVAVAAAPRWP